MTLQEILRSKDRCGGCKDQDKNVYKSECFDCLTKKKDNYELDELLKAIQENAAKWDMIQWAIENRIGFMNINIHAINNLQIQQQRSVQKYLVKLDLERLEQLYKESEQNDSK